MIIQEHSVIMSYIRQLIDEVMNMRKELKEIRKENTELEELRKKNIRLKTNINMEWYNKYRFYKNSYIIQKKELKQTNKEEVREINETEELRKENIRLERLRNNENHLYNRYIYYKGKYKSQKKELTKIREEETKTSEKTIDKICSNSDNNSIDLKDIERDNSKESNFLESPNDRILGENIDKISNIRIKLNLGENLNETLNSESLKNLIEESGEKREIGKKNKQIIKHMERKKSENTTIKDEIKYDIERFYDIKEKLIIIKELDNNSEEELKDNNKPIKYLEYKEFIGSLFQEINPNKYFLNIDNVYKNQKINREITYWNIRKELKGSTQEKNLDYSHNLISKLLIEKQWITSKYKVLGKRKRKKINCCKNKLQRSVKFFYKNKFLIEEILRYQQSYYDHLPKMNPYNKEIPSSYKYQEKTLEKIRKYLRKKNKKYKRLRLKEIDGFIERKNYNKGYYKPYKTLNNKVKRRRFRKYKIIPENRKKCKFKTKSIRKKYMKPLQKDNNNNKIYYKQWNKNEQVYYVNEYLKYKRNIVRIILKQKHLLIIIFMYYDFILLAGTSMKNKILIVYIYIYLSNNFSGS